MLSWKKLADVGKKSSWMALVLMFPYIAFFVWANQHSIHPTYERSYYDTLPVYELLGLISIIFGFGQSSLLLARLARSGWNPLIISIANLVFGVLFLFLGISIFVISMR